MDFYYYFIQYLEMMIQSFETFFELIFLTLVGITCPTNPEKQKNLCWWKFSSFSFWFFDLSIIDELMRNSALNNAGTNIAVSRRSFTHRFITFFYNIFSSKIVFPLLLFIWFLVITWAKSPKNKGSPSSLRGGRSWNYFLWLSNSPFIICFYFTIR